ncbi:MAG TPA: hypothetical protein VK963_04320 [Candidatus Saccharimonadales bacterium]|nr:hypothetical protein [Candidatus Saccharimonadales bacterium]
MQLAILGRQPSISLAELISLYGEAIRPLSSDIAAIDQDGIDLTRLGGTLKLARVITTLPTSDWDEITDALSQPATTQLILVGKTGKLTIGLSPHGQKLTQRDLFSTGLELKKRWRKLGYQIRLVPSEGPAITAAQIIHNRMIKSGADITLATSGQQTMVAVTQQVQDIVAYSDRDYGRPARSAKVGMLPPKLAQIMLNLANPASDSTILDPFCGSGVVLQEAILMGFQAIGSDLDPVMIEYSRTNLNWLAAKTPPSTNTSRLEQADARKHRWKGPIGAVVTEGDLGPPLSSPPPAGRLDRLARNARQLTIDFLTNLHPQLPPGTPVVITLPAWRAGSGYRRLNLIDQVTALGYTLKQFLPVQQSDLLYWRKDQIVARELMALTRV